jgi:hypothetical protein
MSFTQYFVGVAAMLSGYGSGTFAISSRSPKAKSPTVTEKSKFRRQPKNRQGVAVLVLVAGPVASPCPFSANGFHRRLSPQTLHY